jgi:NAD(P)-dependent dehydrogenase (short-subunit alcohol dehydrogenase family)
MSAHSAPWRLDGQLALVTGASSGLGRHFARVLAQAGARVAIAARRQDRLASLAAEIAGLGSVAYPVALDVADATAVAACFDEIVRLAGIPTIVVNNAGVTLTRPALEQTEEDWDRVINTNLKGCWLVAQEAARRLVAAGLPGSLVNVASILGERVAGGVAPYAISKAGIIQATKALALEWARHGIRVNGLLSGYIATEFNREFLESEAGARLRGRIPSRRFGQLEDLDGPLLLLASDAGRHMTGSTLAVDGGHLVSAL